MCTAGFQVPSPGTRLFSPRDLDRDSRRGWTRLILRRGRPRPLSSLRPFFLGDIGDCGLEWTTGDLARMPRPFFPDSVVLAWTFYLALVSVTVIATYTDLRYLQIPKWLTMPALALGLLFNILLGAWTWSEALRGSEK